MEKIKKKIITTLFIVGVVLFAVGCFNITYYNFNSNTVHAQSADEFYVVSGAQMRKTDPAGLRFASFLGSGIYDSLVETNNIEGQEVKKIRSDKELGMFIVPESYYNDYELYKIDNAYDGSFYAYCKDVKGKILDFKYNADQIVPVEGGYSIRACIVDILFNNMNRNFMAVSYIGTKEATGMNYRFAYGNESPRSIAYIASAAINDGKGNEYIDSCQLMAGYNQLGVLYDEINNNYSYNGETYSTLEEIGIDPLSAYDIDVKEKQLNCGESFNITPNKALSVLPLKWSSSDENIATVTDGVVNATGTGNVIVTAECGNIKCACNISIHHKNETNLGLGLVKVDNCDCGFSGMYATNNITETGTFNNSDFEAELTSEAAPVGWYNVGGGKISVVDATNNPYDANPNADANGKFLAVVKGNSESVSVISDAFSVNPGETLKVYFDYCSTGMYNKAKITISFYDDSFSNWYTSLLNVTPEVTGNYYHIWQPFECGEVVVPLNAKYAAVILKGEAYTGSNCFYDNVRITRFGLNKSSAVLHHGETLQLQPTGTIKNKELTWTSENTDIAQVTNTGLVTAGNAIGNTNIIGTFEGGQVTCNIEVIHNLNGTAKKFGIQEVTCDCGYKGVVATNKVKSDGSFANSDFELGCNETGINNWTKEGVARASVELVNGTTNTHEANPNADAKGNFLAFLKEENSGYVFLESDAFDVKESEKLKVNFNYCSTGKYNKAFVKINFYDGVNFDSPLSSVIAEVTGNYWHIWQPFTTNEIVVPAGVKFATIVIGSEGFKGGTSYYDDVQLIR